MFDNDNSERLTKFGKVALGDAYQTPEQREGMDRKLEKESKKPVMTIVTENGPETIIG